MSNDQYGDQDYWNSRFDVEENFEWCKNFEYYQKELNDAVPKDAEILILGCGTSTLGKDMLNSGWKYITSIDYSSRLIEKLKKMNPEMNYYISDIRAMVEDRNIKSDDNFHRFSPKTFDVIIEKGTLDCFFTQEKSPWETTPKAKQNVDAALANISALLRDGGKFISVTWAQPHFRRQHYERHFAVVIDMKVGDGWYFFLYIAQKPRHTRY